MTNNNNDDQLIMAPELLGEGVANTETVKEDVIATEPSTEVKALSDEALAKIVAALKAAQVTNFKHRLQGKANTAKPKINRSFHNGELILTSERNKLSWEEIHASNNIIRK
jgi:hypothetical protein